MGEPEWKAKSSGKGGEEASFLQTSKQEGEDPSKQPQVDDAGVAVDATCDFAPEFDSSLSGWMNQPLTPGTNHYRVLMSRDECGPGMYVNEVFSYTHLV